MEFDDLIRLIGEFGQYQKWLYFSICLLSFPIAFFNLSIVFLAGVPEHRCALPELSHLNVSEDMLRNVSIPMEMRQGKWQHSQCNMYIYNRSYVNITTEEFLDLGSNPIAYGRSTIQCNHGWWYDTAVFTSTIVTDWDLVCDRRIYITMIEAINPFGYVFGFIMWGILADKFGRRGILMCALTYLFATSTLLAFSQNAIMFLIVRFLQAFQNSWGIGFVLAIETTGPSKRTMVGSVIEFYWAAGFMVIAAVAYFIRDWFYIELFIAGSVVPFAVFYWTLTESPRWLYSVNRSDEANKIIKRIAEVNKADIPEKFDVEVKQEEPPRFYHLFKYRKLRNITFNIMYNSAVSFMVYYGITLNIGDLAGNFYFNFFVSGAVEIPAYVFTWLVLAKFGRRWPYVGSMGMAGVSLMCSQAVPHDLAVISVVLVMIGKFAISMAFAILIVYLAEIYPTLVRTAGAGLAGAVGCLGQVAAPYIGDLSHFTNFAPLPNLIFGGLAIIASLLAILLPETHNRYLPDTLEDAEHLGKKLDDRELKVGVSNEVVHAEKQITVL